jgi:hypothetical protein
MLVRLAKKPVISLLKKYLPRLRPEFLERNLHHSLLNHEFRHLFKAERIEKREAVWDRAIERVGKDQPILVLEFGVWEGYSLRYFAERFTHPQSRLYGFDSFEGLPEDWGNKPTGTFSTAGAVPQIADPRVSFVKGWFQDTLPGFTQDASNFKGVLVHMDADLYSSTLFVLSQLWAKFDSFHVVFDEFFGHETRALYNFTQAFPCTLTFLAYDHPYPNRVLCHIARKSL